MLGKIALEEAWAIPENFVAYDVSKLAPPGVIGGNLVENLMDVHGTRLQQMDENGVDLMVLSLSSPGPQGVTDPAGAAALATLANDRLADEVARNPRRFAALASLSMHDPAEAGRELRRVFAEKQGFVGVILNDYQSAEDGTPGPDGSTAKSTKMLFYDAPEYDAFWAVAQEVDAPVYVHPREATALITEQMWKARPWLAYSALGYAQRVSMHVLGIVTAGVLDRFPRLRLVIGHMGEHIPYDLYRIDHKLNRAGFPRWPWPRTSSSATTSAPSSSSPRRATSARPASSAPPSRSASGPSCLPSTTPSRAYPTAPPGSTSTSRSARRTWSTSAGTTPWPCFPGCRSTRTCSRP